VLNEQLQTLASVKVVDELSVIGNFRESKTIDELVLPQHTQTPLHHVVIPATEPHQLRNRGESKAEHNFEHVQITGREDAAAWGFRPNEF
jgi:hypothetical protein